MFTRESDTISRAIPLIITLIFGGFACSLTDLLVSIASATPHLDSTSPAPNNSATNATKTPNPPQQQPTAA